MYRLRDLAAARTSVGHEPYSTTSNSQPFHATTPSPTGTSWYPLLTPHGGKGWDTVAGLICRGTGNAKRGAQCRRHGDPCLAQPRQEAPAPSFTEKRVVWEATSRRPLLGDTVDTSGGDAHHTMRGQRHCADTVHPCEKRRPSHEPTPSPSGPGRSLDPR